MRGMASLATGNYSLGISRNSRFPPTSFLIRWSFSLFSPGVSWMALSLVLTRPVRCWLGQKGEKLVWSLCLAGGGGGHLGSLDPRHIVTRVPLPYLTRCSPGSLVVFPGALGLLLGWSSRHMGPGAGWVPRKGPLIALVDRYLACPVFSVMLGTV